MSHPFQPLQINPRPMCQCAAADGTPGDRHLVHPGHLALSGASLRILEDTAAQLCTSKNLLAGAAFGAR